MEDLDEKTFNNLFIERLDVQDKFIAKKFKPIVTRNRALKRHIKATQVAYNKAIEHQHFQFYTMSSWGDCFSRSKLMDISFARRVMPPKDIPKGDRSSDHDTLIKIVDPDKRWNTPFFKVEE